MIYDEPAAILTLMVLQDQNATPRFSPRLTERHGKSSTMYFRLIFALLASSGALALPAFCSGEKGWFGFAMTIDTEGFSLNPTLRSITVAAVTPSSPAATAGLAVGDTIVQVQDIVVAGAKANDLKPAMHKLVGEKLQLKIKHEKGKPVDVTLTAVVTPSST